MAIENIDGDKLTIWPIDSTLIEVITPPPSEYYIDYDGDELSVHTYFPSITI